jgi:hypothetical protein
MRVNGGIIGPQKDITTGTASGIWSLTDAQKERGASNWPNTVPVISNGLQLYLDAGNLASYPRSGNTWYDISGNGRNFTWNSVSFTPGPGPIGYFSTSGRRCTGPASNSFGITNTSGYTIYLIMYQNAANNTSAFKFYSSNGSGSAGRAIFAHCTWGDGIIYFDQGGCCNADQRVNVSGGTMNTWNIIVFRQSQTERQIIKNNTVLATGSGTPANINLSSTAVDLGSSDEYGGDSSSFDARIGQFIVYNRTLSTDEMTTNYNLLRTRYGLA